MWLEIIVSLEKNSGASQWINISSFYNPAWKQRNACRHNLQASLQICSQQMWLCWHILSDVSCPFKHFIFRRGDLDISNRIMTHFSPNIFQYGMMGKLLFIDVISQLTNKKGFSMKSLTSTQKHYPVHSDHLKRTTVIKHLPSTFFLFSIVVFFTEFGEDIIFGSVEGEYTLISGHCTLYMFWSKLKNVEKYTISIHKASI